MSDTDIILRLFSLIHNANCHSAKKESVEAHAYCPDGRRASVFFADVHINTGDVNLLWNGTDHFDSLVCRNLSSRNDLDEIPDSDTEAQLGILRAAGIYTPHPLRLSKDGAKITRNP